MLAKKILKNLENGNYRIEHREKCDCGFYWHVKNGEFVCDTINNGGCYHENVLIMDDLAGEFDGVIGIDYDGIIATFNSHYGVSLQILCSDQDIAKKIHTIITVIVLGGIFTIINDPEIIRDLIASLNYPDKRNELHERRRDKAFVEFLGIRKEMIL